MSISKSYRSPKTIVKASPKSGKGLFARVNIHKGELVAIKMGRIFTHEELNATDGRNRDFSLQITEEFHLGSRNAAELEEAGSAEEIPWLLFLAYS